MSNITRTIRRNQARLVIGDYVDKKNAKRGRKIKGGSKALRNFWHRLKEGKK